MTKSSALAILLLPLVQAVAFAQSSDLHADGFKLTVRCVETSSLKKVLKDNGKNATGFIASSPRFDLEIYAAPPTTANGLITNWTLVGSDRQGKLCPLVSSEVRSFTEDDWFARYYKPQLGVQK